MVSEIQAIQNNSEEAVLRSRQEVENAVARILQGLSGYRYCPASMRYAQFLSSEGAKVIEEVTNLPVITERLKHTSDDGIMMDHQRLLEALGISTSTEIKFLKRTIAFRTDEPVEQHLRVFSHKGENGERLNTPIVVFLHGGTIGEDVIGSSAYVPVLVAAGMEGFIVAPTHRGTENHISKTDRCLHDRSVDALVSLLYAIHELGEEWNGKLFIIGDSMGGHVASVVAGMFASRNPEFAKQCGLMLAEPAAYAVGVDFLHYVHFVKDEVELTKIVGEVPSLGVDQKGELSTAYGNVIVQRINEEKEGYGNRYGISYHRSDVRLDKGTSARSFREHIRSHKATSEGYFSSAFRGLYMLLNNGGTVRLSQPDDERIVPPDVAEIYRLILNSFPSSTKSVMVQGTHGCTDKRTVLLFRDFVNESGKDTGS